MLRWRLASQCYTSTVASAKSVGVFNHFGTVSAIIGVWFGAVCVSGVDNPLPKR